ncbi:hypothetical protein IGI04_032348 [Brassica rapa subsp. trilocularis]|uniref:ABC transmembrane type-1 domain-containing protein n=1 Tax=Brassica rapa subsp. trilocularis TaxID=1813537 RepID=A0ABQ7LX08_BRACM|nr:hypothetical protein IGI04_032348 [Brassica rapa subsp. trilocularis]
MVFGSRVACKSLIRAILCILHMLLSSSHRILYIVNDVRYTLIWSLIAWLVVGAWEVTLEKLQTESDNQVMISIEKVFVVVALVFSTCLVKSVIANSLAAWFHVSMYGEKIVESLYYEYLLEVLTGVAAGIKCESDARTEAEKIFQNVAIDNSQFTGLEDLEQFLRKDYALKTLNIFRRTYEANEDILWTLIAALLIPLLGWGPTIYTILIITSSFVVTYFCGQPFYVGDEVEIEEVKMYADELRLMETVFKGIDKQYQYLSNFGLYDKLLKNNSRSELPAWKIDDNEIV